MKDKDWFNIVDISKHTELTFFFLHKTNDIHSFKLIEYIDAI